VLDAGSQHSLFTNFVYERLNLIALKEIPCFHQERDAWTTMGAQLFRHVPTNA
jgi:hypothetical protein